MFSAIFCGRIHCGRINSIQNIGFFTILDLRKLLHSRPSFLNENRRNFHLRRVISPNNAAFRIFRRLHRQNQHLVRQLIHNTRDPVRKTMDFAADFLRKQLLFVSGALKFLIQKSGRFVTIHRFQKTTNRNALRKGVELRKRQFFFETRVSEKHHPDSAARRKCTIQQLSQLLKYTQPHRLRVVHQNQQPVAERSGTLQQTNHRRPHFRQILRVAWNVRT